MFNNDDEQVDYGNSLYSKVDPKFSFRKFASAHQVLRYLKLTVHPCKKKTAEPQKESKGRSSSHLCFFGGVCMLNFRAFTLHETEITPENRTSQKEVAPANHSFSGLNAASS